MTNFYYREGSHAVTDGYLFYGTSSGYGLIFVDTAALTAKWVLNNGYYWTEFTDVEGGTVITQQYMPFNRKMYWDNATKTLTEI